MAYKASGTGNKKLPAHAASQAMTNTLIRKIYNRISRKSWYAADNLMGISGMQNSFYRNARGARILIYHGICAAAPLKFNSLFITREIFEQQLRLFKQFFNPISLDDFYAQKFSDSRFNICLSFDDGFANNHKYVLPLLEQYEIPAVFFVTAIRNENMDILWNDFLTIATTAAPAGFNWQNRHFSKNSAQQYQADDSGRGLADLLRDNGFEGKQSMMHALEQFSGFRQDKKIEEYWLQMTVAEIKQMAASRWVTIGSHGYYHNDLARISRKELIKELVGSKSFLETVTGKQIRSLAFPYGSYSSEVVKEAMEAGYEQLLAAEFNSEEDGNNPMLRERMGINPFITSYNQMTSIIKERYHD
jgi:peptidoglycan/xylan/chitin deacetylase (PgdA/CDA1 family)